MTLKLLALCLTFVVASVVPAAAQDDLGPEPGLRFAVTGIAGDDVLNVRNDAGTDGDIIAALPREATGLIVSGNWQKLGSSVWWEVVPGTSSEARGWVNSRYLAQDPAFPSLETGYPLLCQGTEPFWGLSIDGAAATGDADYLEDQSFAASDWLKAYGLRGWYAIALTTEDASAQDAILTFTRAQCSDGMSDRDYPFLATLVLPDRSVYGGCCYRSAP